MDFRDLAGMSGAEYLRKSRKDSESETIQEVLMKHNEELTEFAIRWKLNIIDTFQEVVSGDKIEDRPEVQKLLKNVEDLKYEFVLVIDLDRLGRGDMEDQGKILGTFKETDTFIITPRKIYDLNDELDEEVSEFETFIARRELKLIKRRLLRGRLRSARKGKFIGSIPPFGYDKNNECVLIPNKDAEIIKTIFNWFVNGDELSKPMGAYKIAKKLSDMNILTPTGKKIWQPNSVLVMLTNKVYVGRIIWQPKITKRDNQLIEKRNRDHEKIDVVGKHEPIIENDIFEKAQLMLKEKSNPHLGIRKNLRNPFLGLCICGYCEITMQVKKPGGNRKPQITCKSVVCNNVSSLLELVENKILQDLKDYLNDLKLEEQRIRDGIEIEHKSDENYSKVIEQLKKDIKLLKNQEDKLDTLLEQGVYDISKYVTRSKKIKEDIQIKKSSLINIENQNQLLNDKNNVRSHQIKIITSLFDLYKQKQKNILLINKLLKEIIIKIYYIKNTHKRSTDDFYIKIIYKQKI